MENDINVCLYLYFMSSFYEMINKAMKERDSQYVRKEGEVYVTDIVTCTLKRNGQFDLAVLFRGIALHEGTQKFLSDYLKGSKVEVEKEVSKRYGDHYLKGRVDLVIDGVPYEIKTANKLPITPRIEHLYQLRIYMYLLNVDVGKLVYITFNEIDEWTINKDEVYNEKTGQKLFQLVSVDDNKIQKLINDFVSRELIAPFHECFECYLVNKCEKSLKARK